MSEWDDGFEAGVVRKRFDGSDVSDEWYGGYCNGRWYSTAIERRPAGPRDTEINDLEEFMR